MGNVVGFPKWRARGSYLHRLRTWGVWSAVSTVIVCLCGFIWKQRQEDLRAENIRLNQQLESSVLDARRQVDSQKEKALVKVGWVGTL